MKQSNVESPCISICRYENEICVGCGRTGEEVTEWNNYSDKQKQKIINRLEKDTTSWFE